MFACQILEVGADERARHFLEGLGHTVVECDGPGAAECPLLEGGECDKMGHATGIIFKLDLHDPKHRAILRMYRREFMVPIRVVVEPGEREQFPELLEGLQISEGELGTADLDGFAALVETEAAVENV